jgi:hypothetical protein
MHAIDSALQRVRRRKGYLIACNCNVDGRCWNLNTLNLWLYITARYVKQGSCKNISDHLNPLMYSVLSSDGILLLYPCKPTPLNFEHPCINMQGFVCVDVTCDRKSVGKVVPSFPVVLATLQINKCRQRRYFFCITDFWCMLPTLG